MGFWNFLSFKRRQATHPAIAALAAEIERNLRALGLFVEARPHGAAFVEISASTSPKLTTTPGAGDASGVALLLAGKFDPPALVFEQINSIAPGLGGQMVKAALDGLRARPGVLAQVRVNDLSPIREDGRRWWERMAMRHADFDWRITHDPDETHWPALLSTDFLQTREKLRALAKEFGADPDCVTLSRERKVFDFLGQSFASEGEATPDGRVTIFYDPQMSDARLGCCLAHELQHLRYFVVRDAYRAEPPDGPLHRRFAAFTPETLAAAGGVSAYSNEHWGAWKGASLPRLFSDELAEGGSEPINETIAEVAKALYNWGPDARVNPVWRELRDKVDTAYRTLTG